MKLLRVSFLLLNSNYPENNMLDAKVKNYILQTEEQEELKN
jgi:hypothetical protein